MLCRHGKHLSSGARAFCSPRLAFLVFSQILPGKSFIVMYCIANGNIPIHQMRQLITFPNINQLSQRCHLSLGGPQNTSEREIAGNVKDE